MTSVLDVELRFRDTFLVLLPYLGRCRSAQKVSLKPRVLLVLCQNNTIPPCQVTTTSSRTYPTIPSDADSLAHFSWESLLRVLTRLPIRGEEQFCQQTHSDEENLEGFVLLLSPPLSDLTLAVRLYSCRVRQNWIPGYTLATSKEIYLVETHGMDPAKLN